MEPRAYVFGKFRIDVGARQLLREGEHVPLPAKSLDTLLLLVRHRDRVVGKDELMQTVWPDTFVSDDSLTQCISSLRRALGDAEVIATIPRRGYRFIVPVIEGGEEAKVQEPAPPAAAAAAASAEAAVPGPVRAARRRPRWAVPLAAGILVAITVGGWLARRPAAAPPPPLRFTQEAPTGTVILSGGTLSPDGRTLAFVAEDVQSGTTRLWVRPLASASARVLEGTDSALRPFWSPDSQSLGFIANGRL
jgi:DNA-binding winged helix-turn-helix (wHTH) protein